MSSALNSRKPFQRIIRYPAETLGMLARHIEQLEDNIAKKFRGQDAVIQEVVPAEVAAPVDDRIYGSLDFSIGAGTVADLKLYTVPTFTPRPATGVFILSRPICWLTDRLGATDTGNVNVRIGTTLGGNEIMTDQNVAAATLTGVLGGLSIASLGVGMLAANGYEMSMASHTSVYVRASTTGIITQGTVLVELFGYFFPTADNG